MNDIEAVEEIGLRERKKRDRLHRIKSAARELFIEKGYDKTTIREIARHADLGAGTIFRYAEDKRDLLFQIIDDDLFKITAVTFRDLDRERPLLDQLVAVFRPYYAYFASQPMMARYLLREMTFYVAGGQAPKINEGRDRLIEGIEDVVAEARKRGRIRSGESDATIALLIFDIYQAESRRWLHDETPALEAGLAAFRRAIRLVIDGLHAAVEEI